MVAVFEQRVLGARKLGTITLLDAVGLADGQFMLAFDDKISPGSISFSNKTELVAESVLGGCSTLIYRSNDTKKVSLQFAGSKYEINLQNSELDFFEGRNAILAIRNGEPAEIVADWLEFHVKEQGLEAALIIDRAAPNKDQGFLRKLKKKTKDLPLASLVVLRSPSPLGVGDLPSEQHPYCAPQAPGKDRMEIPKADPWQSPLGYSVIYEIMHRRFLSCAKAVANIDVSDLLQRLDGPTVFDQALSSDTGLIQLVGQPCYPWRIRPKSDTQFGDHICVPFDQNKTFKRWCIAPKKAGDTLFWQSSKIRGGRIDSAQSYRFFDTCF